MRRLLVGVAILSLAATAPMAWAGDREIAQQIIQTLKEQRDAGRLKGFTLDLKVDDGVVHFRGEVSDAAQRAAVLGTAKGVEGVRDVVDEIAMKHAAAAPKSASDKPAAAPTPEGAATPAGSEAKPAVVKTPAARIRKAPEAAAENKSDSGFSLKEALRAVSPGGTPKRASSGAVVPVSATEDAKTDGKEGDDALQAAIVQRLTAAKREGQLRGFGVDLSVENGTVRIDGRVTSPAQKALLVQMVRRVPGVKGIDEEIAITGGANSPAPLRDMPVAEREIQPVSAPIPAALDAPSRLQPVAVQDVNRKTNLPAGYGGVAGPVQAAPAPHRQDPSGGTQAQAAGYPMPVGAAGGMPAAAYPVPTGAAGVGYDQPYMPNYAWPGYAAYPNYAAVSYPQQYSPSAWPYIGPFYPYPQVPLGWRRVSLEWDDGWWYLDFTDRNSTFGRHFGRH